MSILFLPQPGLLWSQTITWSGGGGNDDWTNSANWDSFTLSQTNANLDLVFQGTAQTTNQLRADWTVNSITFSNNLSPFSTTPGTSGADITINGGGITNSSANDVTFSSTLDWTLGANQSWLVESGANLRILGAIGGTGQLVKTGDGTLLLNNNGNSFSGGFVLSNGTVLINPNGALGNAPATFVGGTTARVLYTNQTSNLIVTNATLLSGTGANTNLFFRMDNSSASDFFIQLMGTNTTSAHSGLNVVIHNTGSNPNSGLSLNVPGTKEFANQFVISNGSALILSTAAGPNPSTNVTVLSGHISGHGRILRGERSGGNAGTLVLLSSNSYSGGTFLYGGAIGIGNNHALGTGTLEFHDHTSGTLPARAQLFATNGNVTITNDMMWSRKTLFVSNNTASHRLQLRGNDGITFAGNLIAALTNQHGQNVEGIRIETINSGVFVFTGNIIATNGTQYFEKQGTNALTLVGNSNQISGNIHVTGGTLALSNTSINVGDDFFAANAIVNITNSLVDFAVGKGLVLSNGATLNIDGSYSNLGHVTFLSGSTVAPLYVTNGDLFYVEGNMSNNLALTIHEPGGSSLPSSFGGLHVDGFLSNFGTITWNFSAPPSGTLGTAAHPYYGGIRSANNIFAPYLNSSGFFTSGFFVSGPLGPNQLLKTYFDGSYYYLAIIPEPSAYTLMFLGGAFVFLAQLLHKSRRWQRPRKGRQTKSRCASS